jgi:protein gp37
VIVRSKTTFNDPVKWMRSRKLHKGARIFTCSYSDFFIEEADAWRDEAWGIIERTPDYWYLILTKRPERMYGAVEKIAEHVPQNVVWMVTAENQQTADERIPQLLALKQLLGEAVVGVSIEPQLEHITIAKYLPVYRERYGETRPIDRTKLDWVICGGESGPSRRMFKIEWAWDLLVECGKGSTPFFMKQLGGWPNKHGKMEDFPPGLRIRQFPKALEVA